MTTSRIPPVHETVVDGVTTFWVDAPPPAAASLAFRVGMWDENVFNRGITHLAEHLAIFPVRDLDHGFNGQVDGVTLAFGATGSDRQLVDFIGAICGNLGTLPADRLETEAGVLRAEAAQRPLEAWQYLLSVLFGPSGPGLYAQPERGFDLLGPNEVQRWAATRATRENAVLLCLGRPPDGLRLDLPAGTHRPYRLDPDGYRCEPAKLEHVESGGGIHLGMLARRSTPASMALQLIHRRLINRLRHEKGLVYDATLWYQPLDRDTAFLYLGTAAPEDGVEATAREFVAEIHRMRDGEPTEDEMTWLRESTFADLEGLDDAAVARGELGRVGYNRLYGHSEDTWETLMQERADAAPADLAAAFREATEHSLVLAPAVEFPAGLGLTRKDLPMRRSFRGKRFTSRRREAGELDYLVVADEGVSAAAHGRWLNFRWDDIVLAERTGPNRWSLLQNDGSELRIDTSTWWWRRRLAKMLERGIPEAVRLPRPRGD